MDKGGGRVALVVRYHGKTSFKFLAGIPEPLNNTTDRQDRQVGTCFGLACRVYLYQLSPCVLCVRMHEAMKCLSCISKEL